MTIPDPAPRLMAGEKWRFRTARYEAVYWETRVLSVAEIWDLPRGEWPIAVAVDVRKTKSRQCLVREACDRATEKLLIRHLPVLLSTEPR